jgi:hypothetical protein
LAGKDVDRGQLAGIPDRGYFVLDLFARG